MKHWLLCLALAAMPLSLTACQLANVFSSGPEVGVNPRPIYEDVPVLAGLAYNEKESTIYDTPGYRACELRYSGIVKPMTAVDYYRQQMQTKTWQYLNLSSSGGTYTLDFKKPNEKCTVTIVGQGDVTNVTVKISNDSSNAAPGGSKGR